MAEIDIETCLSPLFTISGEVSVPNTVDRTAIHYGTTEEWNRNRDLIAERSHLYVYSDYKTEINDNGDLVKFPAIKIGDGTSYLIDMPFIATLDFDNIKDVVQEHISNTTIHITNYERSTWNEKLSARVNESEEQIIFVN